LVAALYLNDLRSAFVRNQAFLGFWVTGSIWVWWNRVTLEVSFAVQVKLNASNSIRLRPARQRHVLVILAGNLVENVGISYSVASETIVNALTMSGCLCRLSFFGSVVVVFNPSKYANRADHSQSYKRTDDLGEAAPHIVLVDEPENKN
jgi:hypothetical protein